MSAGTPWESGRFDARAGPKRILFGRMYEDAAIEEREFAPGTRVFCIASAGCTAMALARHRRVTAVDINPVQLAYAQQRAAGAPARVGSAERVLAAGRRLLALIGWRRSTLRSFLALEEPAEQCAFWDAHLNSAAFRAATDILFSVRWLRLAYAVPFLSSLPPHFGRVMRSRLERCWKIHPNRTNPYARGLLLGESSDVANPGVGARIRFERADAAEFLESCPPRRFDGFTLSNILDGATDRYRQRLLAAIRRAATPQARVVSRSFAEPPPELTVNHAASDRSMLWGIVDVRAVDGL